LSEYRDRQTVGQLDSWRAENESERAGTERVTGSETDARDITCGP